MTEVEVSSVASFLDVARKVCKGFGKTHYWYRGHVCSDWHLVPSVHRRYDSRGERNLAGRFRLAAPTRYANCPDLPDEASWLSLMQHFGLPTRLLDWTASPLAALFFAVAYEQHQGPGAVWILVPSELNKRSSHGTDVTVLLHGPEARALVRAAFGGGQATDETLAVLGRDVDLRVTVQQGAFTIHGNSTPLERLSGAERFLMKLVVPEAAKPMLEEELWVLGIRRSTLFPDLANLARDLATDRRLVPWRIDTDA